MFDSRELLVEDSFHPRLQLKALLDFLRDKPAEPITLQVEMDIGVRILIGILRKQRAKPRPQGDAKLVEIQCQWGKAVSAIQHTITRHCPVVNHGHETPEFALRQVVTFAKDVRGLPDHPAQFG